MLTIDEVQTLSHNAVAAARQQMADYLIAELVEHRRNTLDESREIRQYPEHIRVYRQADELLTAMISDLMEKAQAQQAGDAYPISEEARSQEVVEFREPVNTRNVNSASDLEAVRDIPNRTQEPDDPSALRSE